MLSIARLYESVLEENARYYGLPEGASVAHPESFVAEATFNKMLAEPCQDLFELPTYRCDHEECDKYGHQHEDKLY